MSVEYKYLEKRKHPWRKQLYLKERNMTVNQVIRLISSNELTIEETAEDLNVTIEAIMEALEYAKENKEVLIADSLLDYQHEKELQTGG